MCEWLVEENQNNPTGGHCTWVYVGGHVMGTLLLSLLSAPSPWWGVSIFTIKYSEEVANNGEISLL